MADPSLFLIIIGCERGIGELFSTTVAPILPNQTTVGFSKEEAVSDVGSFFRTWVLV